MRCVPETISAIIAAMPLYDSTRAFRVARWNVGHSWLLLRSDKSEEHPSTVDVSFKPASAVCLPHTMHGLQIAQVESGDALLSARHLLGRPLTKWEHLFTVDSDAEHGWVVCGAVAAREDDGSSDHPPTFFSGWAPPENVRTLFSTYVDPRERGWRPGTPSSESSPGI